ncbi:hypothetical protein CYLTODRAFT_448111 [Cylindrobasidium torrendii FP15055 ss-10]|uniref:Uncharacterized protein n=1 Tax=Cylindrobasidium torrendii FP15055 ss-10 TaxID=1314674 RepID=A0A0D7BVZ7_9AGAR|nr:hypothetical protein CYLTODRAFT_448111 [Cylindrobasidium torrendii FP15055 ss-10]
MSPTTPGFYAIPPALLLAIPLSALAVIVSPGHRQVRGLKFTLPILLLSLVALLVAILGIASSIALQTITSAAVAIYFLVLITRNNFAGNSHKTNLVVYNIGLSIFLTCATILAFISLFLPLQVTPLIPPFLNLIFATLTIPLVVYFILARPPASASTYSDSDSTPATPDDLESVPPDSPTIYKQAFELRQIFPPRPASATVPVEFPQSSSQQCSTSKPLFVLLLAQLVYLLAMAFDICIAVLTRHAIQEEVDKGRTEMETGVWKTVIGLRCFEGLCVVVGCGCTMLVWKWTVGEHTTPPRPTIAQGWWHRRTLSNTSSFCSPGLGLKGRSPSVPFATMPQEAGDLPSPERRERSPSGLLNELRESIHSFISDSSARRSRLHPPSLPLRTQSTQQSRRSASPPMTSESPAMPGPIFNDVFDTDDPFAAPAPRLAGVQQHRPKMPTTRLSAWGALTLPSITKSLSRPNSRKGRGPSPITNLQSFEEEARVAERVLEKLKSSSTDSL